MFAPIRTGRSNLLCSCVFLVLLLRAILASSNTSSQAQDDLDKKIVQDLKSDHRKIFSIGVIKSRLVVLVSHAPVGGFMDEEGWSTVDPPGPTTTPAPYDFVKPAPDDYYVYDMPSSAFTPACKLYLHGGVLLKDKWPSLHDWLVKPENNFKSEPGDWLQDYAYMFASDKQHEYLVILEIDKTNSYGPPISLHSFVIDKTGGTGEQVKNMSTETTENIKVRISSTEPMSFYYVNVKDGATPQTVPYRLGDSNLGGQPPHRDFALGKQAFNGSTSLAEATIFTNVGQIYAICKSGESEIVTQEARAQLCNETVEWDIRLGFVDSADRMVLLDEHMTMRSFPRSALTPDGVGKPVKVETVKRGQFLEKGLPLPPSPDSNNQSNNPRGDANGSSSSGLVIGIIVVLLIVVIAALVAAYCLCCKDGKDSAKKGSTTPGSKGSGKKGSDQRKKGGSSKKVSGKGSSKGSVKGPSKGPSKGSGKGSSQSKKGASSKKVSGKASSKGSVKRPSKGPSKGGPSKGGPSKGGPSKGGPSKGGPSKGSVKDSAKVSTKGSSKGRSKRLSKRSVKRSSKRQSKPSSKGKASSKRLTKRSTKLSSKKNSKKSTK